MERRSQVMTRTPDRIRIVYAGVVAATAIAAPVLVLALTDPSRNDQWFAAWIVIVGPLVFQLLSRPRPEWGWGVAFAAVVGAVFGIWGGWRPPLDLSGPGEAALMGVLIFLAVLCAGMVGASIASLITRLFPKTENEPPRRGPLKPWHVGAAIAAADVLVVALSFALAA